ncbi:hypothetical protein AAF712_013369 [Marasmius tenuissimus]|uniref:Uncharacterized protein n=1 Tax=Marasmius tenuissimus TaxID=585030 RepID=A0ABR2ZF59_9AGAR
MPSEAGFSSGPSCRGCSDSWCQGCALEPDQFKAFGGTWMVANHFKGEATGKYLQFDFVGAYPCIMKWDTLLTSSVEGTAVTIYCIVPNLPSSSGLVTQYAIDFRIDGQLPPNGKTIYNHASDSSGNYTYNVPVFNQTGLTNEKHTMMVRMMPVPDVDAVLLFDYATYIFDDPNVNLTPFSSSANSSGKFTTVSTNSASTIPPTSTPGQDDSPRVTGNQRKHLIVILGSSIGSFVVVLAFGVLLIRYLRRRHVESNGPRMSQTIHPFTTINPRIPKNRLKDLSTGSTENLASGSGAHPQEPAEGEGVDSVDSGSEDPPPEYSSRPDFPL